MIEKEIQEYIDAEFVWKFIDVLQDKVDVDSKDPIGKTCEAFKMYLLGQQDIINKIAEHINGTEKTATAIAKLSSSATPSIALKTLENDKVAEVYAEEWYATHGPIGRPIFSLDCREAFLAGFSIAMQLVKSQVALEAAHPPIDSSTHFEPCVRLSKLPKQVRP